MVGFHLPFPSIFENFLELIQFVYALMNDPSEFENDFEEPNTEPIQICPIPQPVEAQNSPLWEGTLNRIIPAVVSIRSISVRNFGQMV